MFSDHDGDKITIFNTLDFEIFYDLMIQKVFLVINTGGDDYPIYTPTTEEAARKIPASNATPAGPSVANGAGGVLHPGVICDQCEKEIVGYRYKCLQCRDYDLCMVCESKMSHKEHAMIRIPDSAEFVSNQNKAFLNKNSDIFISYLKEILSCSYFQANFLVLSASY